MWIDVGKLIREQVPDKNGKVLPADLTSGSYEFRDLTDFALGALFEGKVIYDKTYGHAAYGCANCCGTMSTQTWFNPLGVPFASTAGQGVNGYNNCDLTWDDVSSYFYSDWTSSNTAIATVDYYGTHSGVSAGSTNSTSWANMREGSNGLLCPRYTFRPSGGVNVCALPTNFRQTVGQDAGNGVLHFEYAWDSSSGHLSDLGTSGCTINEVVFYPGGNPFIWPSPPYVSTQTSNPFINPAIAGSLGGLQDNHTNPGFQGPYRSSAITATQHYVYSCTCNGSVGVDMTVPISISRTVSQNADGTWKYNITKSSISASINPLP